MALASYKRAATRNNSTAAANGSFQEDRPVEFGNNVSSIASSPVVPNQSSSPVFNQYPSKSSHKLGTVIGACIAATIVAIMIVCLFWLKLKSRKKKVYSDIEKGGNFSYEVLGSATDAFSSERIIGEGGFGVVYRGVLPCGKEVAIKRLKPNSTQGHYEFEAEVQMINSVHHRHLVSLLGSCIHGGERMLIYEYLPNKTLEHHISRKNGLAMDWPTRRKIAIESAKALAYLHYDCSPQIIHRDIKSSNILIGENFHAKLSDFGLVKFNIGDNTHVSTDVRGTPGYVAPEYVKTRRLTAKSDIYSFGVLLLELMSGKAPLHSTGTDKTFVEWAREILTQRLKEGGNMEEVVDPLILQGSYNSREIARMGLCIVSCTNPSPKRRPKITEVVRGLETDEPLEMYLLEDSYQL